MSPRYMRSLRRKSTVKYKEDSDTDISSNSPTGSDTLMSEIENQLKDVKENEQKSYELFSETDVNGKKLYGFQTPTKRDSLFKASKKRRYMCVNPETSKAFPTLKIILEKIVDSKSGSNSDQSVDTKSSRKKFLPGVDSSGNESVSEGSEFIPTDDDVDSKSDKISDQNEESESCCTSDEEDIAESRVVRNKVQRPVQSTSKSKKIEKRYKTSNDYHMKPDEYFEYQSEKTITSDRTLRRLQNTRLTEQKLEELLRDQDHIPKIHKKCIRMLTENYQLFFPMWQFIMEQGYSLLFYGLGSKRELLNNFHDEIIKDHPTLVINGFFPSLMVKDIISNIIENILDLVCPTNLNDGLRLIKKVLKVNSNDQLYLIIHNLDGIMLRSNKAQDALAALTAIPNVRLLASVDHINAPLLWDNTRCAKFNFYWWDATTFLPYQVETSYESSLLVQQSSAIALSSLRNVFLSLTSNARAIYIILVKYQLKNAGNYAGMLFKDLYRAAREQFLVSSDLALRAQLTEFIDHKLVKTKRNIDGAERVTIPLDKGLLKQFLEQHES